MAANESRVTFEWRITFGNVLTIIGGIVVAATMLTTIVSYANGVKSDISTVSERVNSMECGLANAGILPTTQRCTLARKAER